MYNSANRSIRILLQATLMTLLLTITLLLHNINIYTSSQSFCRPLVNSSNFQGTFQGTSRVSRGVKVPLRRPQIPIQEISPTPPTSRPSENTQVTLISNPASPQSLVPSHIPEKIWYKLGPKGIDVNNGERIRSCLHRNPTYRHEFVSDTTAKMYVREHFAHRLDIVHTFLSLTVPILRADLLRYLILYANGGVWSDLDVSCGQVPINNWIPAEYRDRTRVVVGLEFDAGGKEYDYLWSQFASWTILSVPHSPHISRLINDIITDLNAIAQSYGVDIAGITMDMIPEVVELTGPKRMTWSLLNSLEEMTGQVLSDREISGLASPKLFGDVLVLPGNAFAGKQNEYPEGQGLVFVEHHYMGSWKNVDGGEMGG